MESSSIYRNGVFSGTKETRDELEGACEKGNDEFVLEYIRAGHRVSGTSGHLLALLNYHPLDQSNADRIVRLLVDNGAFVDYRDERVGRTCLQVASEKGHLQLVSYLISRFADVNLADRRGNTALHKALKKPAKVDVFNLLLDRGAKNLRNKGGKTPAYLICKSGDYTCAGRILSRDNVDFGKDVKGRTGLYFAALDSFSQVSKFYNVPMETKHDIFVRGKCIQHDFSLKIP